MIKESVEKKVLNGDLSHVDFTPQSPEGGVNKKPDDDKKTKEAITDEAKLLVKKINEEKREREKRKQELLRLEQEKLAKEIEDRQKKLEEDQMKKDEEKLKKREDAEKRIQQRIQERQQSQNRMIEETKRISKKPKLYQEIEKKFTEEQLKEVDKERLDKLKEIKELRKPVSKDDIENHSRKYDDLMRQKKEELRKKRGGLDTQYDSQDQTRNYKSKFYEDLLIQEKEQKEIQIREKHEKKRVHDKVGSYAKYVKEMYWPQVSEQKRQELESVKENLRHPIRKANELDQSAEVSDLVGGLPRRRNVLRHGTADDRNLQKSKKIHSSVRNIQPRDDVSPSQISNNNNHQNYMNGFNSEPDFHNGEDQNRPMYKKSVLKPINRPKQQLTEAEKKPPQPKDYLREFKSKREGEKRQNKHSELERLINNNQLSEVEKYNLVKIKTDQLEKKAEVEEQMMQVMGQSSTRNVERAIEVNDMYIESIKAKLMMLDQI